jgi:PRC-barrel domain
MAHFFSRAMVEQRMGVQADWNAVAVLEIAREIQTSRSANRVQQAWPTASGHERGRGTENAVYEWIKVFAVFCAQSKTIKDLPDLFPSESTANLKIVHIVIAAGIAVSVPAVSHAQVAGSTLLGVSYGELRDVAVGWSAKRQILGHPVYNNMDERVGSVDDIIVTTDKSVSYAIINAGGFLAVAKHGTLHCWMMRG